MPSAFFAERARYGGTVQLTPELRRILSAPTRTISDQQAIDLAATYTNWLRKPGGTWSLHPHQGAFLHESRIYGGAFGQILAGGGKTLVGYLAPIVCETPKAVLLTNAGLIQKTLNEAKELASHFHIASWLRPISYESLGRVGYFGARDEKGPILETGLLERLDPDLVVCDECHCLKGLKDASVAKRVMRFAKHRREQGRPVKWVFMSGTITNHSILDYAHLVEYSVPRAYSFLPHNRAEVEEWSKAIDKEEMDPGALCLLPGAGEGADIITIRRAYRDRMLATPGVYSTKEGEVGSALSVSEINFLEKEGTHPQAIAEAFALLRKSWKLPDGWQLEDAPRVWAHAQELALGFYYAPVPRPPDEWAALRSLWAKWCRHILTTNRRNLDSELEVTNSVDDGKEHPDARASLEAWRKVRPSFTPDRRAIWLDTTVLERIAHYTLRHREPILVWVQHTAFGNALSQATGIPYFGQLGRDQTGRPIESHRGSAILSISANRQGRNLQAWAHNLSTFVSIGGKYNEQVIARTHRYGQKEDTVFFRNVIHCAEHVAGFDKAINDSHYAQDTTGQPMRLVYGHVTRDISEAHRTVRERLALDRSGEQIDLNAHWRKERE